MQEVFEKIKQKAKERSKKMFVEKLGDKNYVYLQAIGTKELDKIIEQVAEEHNNGWMSVSEGLPKEPGAYLVTFDDGYVTSAPYEKDWELWCDSGEPIAWQPLPEPYQPEGREQALIWQTSGVRYMALIKDCSSNNKISKMLDALKGVDCNIGI